MMDTKVLEEELERGHQRPGDDHGHVVTIVMNEKWNVKIERGPHTGLEIKQTAINQNVPIKIDFLLSHEKENGQEVSIGDRDVVKVKDRDKFTAVDGDDNS